MFTTKQNTALYLKAVAFAIKIGITYKAGWNLMIFSVVMLHRSLKFHSLLARFDTEN